LRKVESALKTQPGLGAAAKRFVEPDRHLGRNSRMAIQHVRQLFAADAELFGRRRDCHAERFQTVAADRKARMRGIFHRHVLAPSDSRLNPSQNDLSSLASQAAPWKTA